MFLYRKEIVVNYHERYIRLDHEVCKNIFRKKDGWIYYNKRKKTFYLPKILVNQNEIIELLCFPYNLYNSPPILDFIIFKLNKYYAT